MRLLLFPIFRKNQQETQYMWTGLPVFSSALQAIGSLVGCLWNIFFPGQQGICVSGPTDPILNLPGCIITQKIRKRELTCEEIIRAFINRIYQVNPLLNAVVGNRFEEAMAEARYVDQVLDSDEPEYDEEKTSLLRKPLLGVPVTVKESLACKGLTHSAGLVDRKDAIAMEDAIVVENLRKAGAIPIAVTNCSEVCIWFETDNVLYGRTNNPYDTSKMAGGSSGGEGSIISAAGSVCGVGSDVGKLYFQTTPKVMLKRAATRLRSSQLQHLGSKAIVLVIETKAQRYSWSGSHEGAFTHNDLLKRRKKARQTKPLESQLSHSYMTQPSNRRSITERSDPGPGQSFKSRITCFCHLQTYRLRLELNSGCNNVRP